MISLSQKEFERIVDDAVAEVPKEFLDKLKNVVIVVQDFPSSDQLKKIGVKNTQDMKPVMEKEVELPISDEKIVSGEHASLTSSLRWLATFCVYILSKAHITLKVIHGKVVRRKQSR